MSNERLRIKHWRVDPAAGTLEHGKTRRRLDPKAMAVLCHLAQRPGEAVTKAELLDAVWQGAAVTDDVLTGAISALRKALGDSPRNPEYIRTLPRVGYTLMTPVRRETGDYLKRGRVPWRARLLFAAGVLGLALVGGVAAWHRAPDSVEWRPLATPRARIAVLPFADRSSDPSDSYLADALSEALITRLARVGDFHVLSWRTARQYRSSDLSLSTLAEELGLHAVLEGSIGTDGSRLRLYARLIDVRGDDHLWAETYDRPLSELLAVEEDLVHRATGAIRERAGLPDVVGHSTARAPRQAVLPEAHREFLKGRYFRHREEELDLERAVGHFQRAIELDPAYAAAHAALAETYFLQTEGKGLSRSAGLELGSVAAAEALRLDPQLGAAHAVDAIVKFCLGWTSRRLNVVSRLFSTAIPRIRFPSNGTYAS